MWLYAAPSPAPSAASAELVSGGCYWGSQGSEQCSVGEEKLLVKHQVILQGFPASIFCYWTSGQVSASRGLKPLVATVRARLSRQSWGWGCRSG